MCIYIYIICIYIYIYIITSSRIGPESAGPRQTQAASPHPRARGALYNMIHYNIIVCYTISYIMCNYCYYYYYYHYYRYHYYYHYYYRYYYLNVSCQRAPSRGEPLEARRGPAEARQGGGRCEGAPEYNLVLYDVILGGKLLAKVVMLYYSIL